MLTIGQIRSLDAYTIEHEPVASIDLMERAATACVDWITELLPSTREAVIFCGPGNNGGDGLAIARLLGEQNWHIQVIIASNDHTSTDFQINLDRLKTTHVPIITLDTDNALPLISPGALVVDAIFGSGLTRPLDGIYSRWVAAINELPNIVIAVDVPSGLFIESPTVGIAVKADFTLSFEVVKPAFLIPENQQYTGEWVILPIGLDQGYLQQLETDWFLMTEEDASRILRTRQKFDHKGIFGHALIIAGGYGKAGAAILSSRAALRAGTGLVTAHVPGKLVDVLQVSVPEAMVDVDAQLFHFSAIEDTRKYSAIGIGPGIGTDEDTVKGLKDLLEDYRHPLVVDADGLNIISLHKQLLNHIPVNSILTPHLKEFERLFDVSNNHFERLDKLRSAAMQFRVVIILKGAHTAIATPEGKLYFNSTGNPGMATAGTGDVLTGIITGLLAQQYTSQEAALLGVYLHGLAGDIAAEARGYEALVATDLIDALGEAFLQLHE